MLSIATVLLATMGTTYAKFSDSLHLHANEAQAGTVVLADRPAESARWEYSALMPSEEVIHDIGIDYRGSIPADVSIGIEVSGTSQFCEKDVDAQWHSLPGGSLEIRFGASGWLDYCSLIGGQRAIVIQPSVAPGSLLSVPVGVRLESGSDYRYSELSETGVLLFLARQSRGGKAFTDRYVNPVSISTGSISPPIPSECQAAGLVDFDSSNTITLTTGNDSYATPVTPEHGRGYLVLGLAGDDQIVGSNQADCIDGGDGNDSIRGGNQHDVLLGGDGNDRIQDDERDGFPGHGNGKDIIYGGDGDDELYGGNGKESMFGGQGNDLLIGGRGTDLLDGGPDEDTCIAPAQNAGGERSLEMFLSCEYFSQDAEGLMDPQVTELADDLPVDAPISDDAGAQDEPEGDSEPAPVDEQSPWVSGE